MITHATAQERRGVLTGTITDTSKGVLKGARVELTPSGQRTTSDTQGLYTVSDVVPGDYTLTVSYVGLAPFSKSVKIISGQAVTADAELQIQSTAESVTVTAERPRGEAAAINQQRVADNLVTVLPAEVITSLPNANIADAIGRLPGVTLERDEGEGKYVQVRSLEPRLTNVTINGINVPSQESNTRAIKLDAIPSALVEAIEVNKTLLANMDGDGIGGSVNLVTKKASDLPTLSINGIGGYMPILGGRPMSEFNATSGYRFGKTKKFGILFGGTYDFNGLGINDIEPGPAVFGSVDLRDYRYSRTRYGFAGGADYRLGAGSDIYINGFFSDFKNYGERWVYSPNINNFVSPTLGDSSGNMLFNASIRRPEYYVASFDMGGHHNLGSTLVDYSFAVSRSGSNGGDPQTNFVPVSDGSPVNNVVFGLDLSNPNRPKFPVLNGVNIYDPTQYALSTTQVLNTASHQLNFSGSADLAKQYTVGSHFGTFQVGLKIRNADKTNNNQNLYYTAIGSPILLSNFTGGGSADPNYYEKSYTEGPFADYAKIQSYFGAHPNQFALDVTGTHQRTDPNNYNTNERVYAEYFMNTIDFGHLRLVAGLRAETTTEQFTGYKVLLNAKGSYVSTSPTPGSSDYTTLLPSVQLRYALTAETNIRFGYSRGISRPDFGQLPPYIIQNDKRNSVSAGNPNLLPTKANNIDVLFEHYLKPLGVIQAGFFYKDLADPIYSTQTKLTSGTYSGYLQTQPTNGSSAYVYGFEIAWQQRLAFLPGYLSGLGVLANYSYIDSQANVPGRIDKPALLRQAPNNWNLGMTYDRKRLSYRLGVTHNDASIYSYAYNSGNSGPFNYTDGSGGGINGPNGDNYLYAHTQVDMQGSYRLTHGVDVVVAILNLNNEVFGFFNGSEKYPNQREYYRPTYQFGFRWNPSFGR